MISTNLKHRLKDVFNSFGFEVRRLPPPSESYAGIPDHDLYRPLFNPWLGKGPFRDFYEMGSSRTLVSIDRCYVLYTLLHQALHVDGDIWECGVYKGGTSAMMASVLRAKSPGKTLHLFDTFQGMPETDSQRDLHNKGDFADTSLESVTAFVGSDRSCQYHQGFIPDTFAGLESARVAMAHIDVDIYRSIVDSLDFIWPRLTVGGFIVFDDYGFPTCPGARMAVDEFFHDKPFVPLCLHTGQAIVFKGPSGA